MDPGTANGILWSFIVAIFVAWMWDALRAWRAWPRRARLAIIAFCASWAALGLDRALIWLGVEPGHVEGDWIAAAVLGVAAAATTWVYLEYRAGEITPPAEEDRR